jgi:hypothetical protein
MPLFQHSVLMLKQKKMLEPDKNKKIPLEAGSGGGEGDFNRTLIIATKLYKNYRNCLKIRILQ